jgi:hypothetical protein
MFGRPFRLIFQIFGAHRESYPGISQIPRPVQATKRGIRKRWPRKKAANAVGQRRNESGEMQKYPRIGKSFPVRMRSFSALGKVVAAK